MPPAPIPANDRERVAATREHYDHAAPIDEALQAIARAASASLDIPIALVSLVDAERQVFSGNIGLEGVDGTSRDVAFCGHTILGEGLLEVRDARDDERFADNPLVTGDPRIVFYAGVPLTTGDGHAVGTLCAIGREPRELSEAERSLLRELADAAMKVLSRIRSLRRSRDELDAALMDAHRASRARSAFFAGVSHELRTPLNAVIGYADLLKAQHFGKMPDPRYVEYLSHIHESGEHLLALINDILDLGQLESGHRQLEPEPLPVEETVDRTLNMAHHQAQKRGVRVRTDIPEGLPNVKFDARAFRQVLLNLVTNALKYGWEGGDVIVRAESVDAGVALEVQDNGPGMTEEIKQRLFQPFARGDSARPQSVEGTGLGLVLCKGLVDAGGGSIEIFSEPGRGTRVRVVLPVKGA